MIHPGGGGIRILETLRWAWPEEGWGALTHGEAATGRGEMGRGHPLRPPPHHPSISARPCRLLTPAPLSGPLLPTRRTVPGAPPPFHRPAGGWAPPCTSEEPAGLCPPGPGLYRSHSGEQAPWTGSGERGRWVAPSHRGVGGGAPGTLRGCRCICVSLPAPLALCLVSGRARSRSGCRVCALWCGWSPPCLPRPQEPPWELGPAPLL